MLQRIGRQLHQLPACSQLLLGQAAWSLDLVACKSTRAAGPTTSYANIPKAKHDPYRTPPKNYVQLLQHITRAKDIGTLQRLVLQYGPRFDAVHVAAAMVMLPKLHEVPAAGARLNAAQLKARRALPAALLEQLQGLAAAQVPRMFVREVASISWALGRCRGLLPPGSGHEQHTRQLVASMLQQLSRDNFRLLHQGASGAEVAQLLHGLARLKLGAAHSSHVAQLCKFITTYPQRLQMRELAAAAWSLAKMPAPAAPQGRLAQQLQQALDAISRQAVETRLYLRPPSMCALLTACAQLQRRDEQLLAAVCEEALHQMRDFRPMQLAVLTSSLGKLRHPLPPELAAAVVAASRVQLEHFSALQLGLLLQGLRRLEALDRQLLADVAAGISKEQAVALSPQDAVQILAAFVAAPDAGLASDVSRMAQHIGDALLARGTASMSPRLATDLLVCYSKLPAQHVLLLRLLGNAAAEPGRFSPRQWVDMLQAADRLQLHNMGEPRLTEFYDAAAGVLHEHLLGPAGEEVARIRARQAAGQKASRSWLQLVKGEDKEQQQQAAAEAEAAAAAQEQHRVQFAAALDMARLLGERGRLSEQSAGLLAGQGLRRFGGLQPRAVMMLLAAVMSGDKTATHEDVRALISAAGARLAGELQQDGGLSLTVLAGLAPALAQAVSRNMLAASGEPLLQQLYERLLPRLGEASEAQLLAVWNSMQRAGMEDEQLQAAARRVADERGWELPRLRHAGWGPLSA